MQFPAQISNSECLPRLLKGNEDRVSQQFDFTVITLILSFTSDENRSSQQVYITLVVDPNKLLSFVRHFWHLQLFKRSLLMHFPRFFLNELMDYLSKNLCCNIWEEICLVTKKDTIQKAWHVTIVICLVESLSCVDFAREICAAEDVGRVRCLFKTRR